MRRLLATLLVGVCERERRQRARVARQGVRLDGRSVGSDLFFVERQRHLLVTERVLRDRARRWRFVRRIAKWAE